MKRKVKLFGERNTATRALKQMLIKADSVTLALAPDEQARAQEQRALADVTADIQDSYKFEWRRLYLDASRDTGVPHDAPFRLWKHASPFWHDDYAHDDVSVIFMVRNPYSWALSMARKPYHMKAPRTADFEQFLSRPWLSERRDNCPILLRSVLHLWNHKLAAYQRFAMRARNAGVRCQFIRFEDFLADPSLALGQALWVMGIPPTGLEAVATSTKDASQRLSDLQDYYLTEGWRMRLTQATVRKVNAEINWGLADTFEYPCLDPQDFPVELPAPEAKSFAFEMMNLDMQAEVDLHRKTGTAATA